MLRHLYKYLWLVPLFLFVSISASAQNFEEICRELFETAFTELGQNCAGLADNSSCYGYGGCRIGVLLILIIIRSNPVTSACWKMATGDCSITRKLSRYSVQSLQLDSIPS